MLLSIIVPAYNIEKYIGRAIESVECFNDDDVEIIVIDDGSKDSTSEIVKKYVASYSNVKLITQENSGVVVARKRGWDAASGEYILHLDGDDFFLKGSLKYIKKLLVDKPDMVIFKYVRTNAETPFQSTFDKNELIGDINVIAQRLFSTSSNNSLCNKCIKRSILNEVKANDFAIVKKGEDRLVLLESFPQFKKVIFDNSILYGYYYRGSSAMHTISESKIDFSFKKTLIDNVLNSSVNDYTKRIIINNELDLFCMNLRRLARCSDKFSFLKICNEYKNEDFFRKILFVGYFKTVKFEKRNNFLFKLFKKEKYKFLFLLIKKVNL